MLVLLGALGVLIYTLAVPVTEKFTEFYLLGPDGKASDYPTTLSVGEEGTVIVGIVNREEGAMTYRVEVNIDGETENSQGPLSLVPGEKWEKTVAFSPGKAGDRQKIEFLLFTEGQSEVYREVHLWVDVR